MCLVVSSVFSSALLAMYMLFVVSVFWYVLCVLCVNVVLGSLFVCYALVVRCSARCSLVVVLCYVFSLIV